MGRAPVCGFGAWRFILEFSCVLISPIDWELPEGRVFHLPLSSLFLPHTHSEEVW